MRSDVLRRVRWGNVARALGVVAVIGLIVAWPRLTPPEPSLPRRDARPLVQPRPAPVELPTEAELRARGRGRRERVGPRDRGGSVERARRGGHVGRRERARGGGRGGQAERADRAESVDGVVDGGGGGTAPAGGGGTATPSPSGDGVMPAPPVVDPAQTEFGIEGG